MKLALLQYSCTDDVEKNVTDILSRISEAAGRGADLVVLPELSQTPYFCQSVDPKAFRFAESIPGPTIRKISESAVENGVHIVVPLFEKATPGIYFNALALLMPDGSLAGVYRKMHIPEDPGFHEKYYFTPGDKGYRSFDTPWGRVGTLICWDQWYPEAARITAMTGAQLLLYPTAIGTLKDEGEAERERFHSAWQLIQRSHAVANGCFVAAVNRCGKEGGTTFWGHSFVSDPFGRIIEEAGDDEEILVADIDLQSVEKQRQEWPFFRDRRIDSYRPLLRRML
ncbi:MAG: carbon-nitrogen hydrolase [Balneolaceae bacterium]